MAAHPAWRSPLHAIHDAISFAVSARPLRNPAFAILDALQFAHPALQLDALFLTAVAMSQTLGIDAHEMIVRAKRLLPAAEGPYADGRIAAISDYANGELRK